MFHKTGLLVLSKWSVSGQFRTMCLNWHYAHKWRHMHSLKFLLFSWHCSWSTWLFITNNFMNYIDTFDMSKWSNSGQLCRNVWKKIAKITLFIFIKVLFGIILKLLSQQHEWPAWRFHRHINRLCIWIICS